MDSVLIIDIETDSLDVSSANMKWFGAFSLKLRKYFFIDFRDAETIGRLINTHSCVVGFNVKAFDIPILARHGYKFSGKTIIDLFEVSAPTGPFEYPKNRLSYFGYKLSSYTLKNICEELQLDRLGKGEIDYKIFQKNEWSSEERAEIIKYLKQDVVLTKKLFEWYQDKCAPFAEMLPVKDVREFVHINSGISTLAYKILCHLAKKEVRWTSKDDQPARKSIPGGHHINPRKEKVAGNIVYLDFNSAYPHMFMQANLFAPRKDGWSGNGYFNLDGAYNSKQLSVFSQIIKDIYQKRLKAKKNKEKIKDSSYKIILNSIYGMCGNPSFTWLYNPTAASDCTAMVRTLLKKCCKTLEEEGFEILYGFTDGFYVLIPPQSNEEELLIIVENFIEDAKKNFPFPTDTFTMGVDQRVKFVWFVNQKANCYLWVTNEDEIGFKSTLLNATAPTVVLELFHSYIAPRIIKELDVNFSPDEIEKQLKKMLELNIEHIGQTYKVKDLSNYKIKTSLQYQIAERYGPGEHRLIPNVAGIGVGRNKEIRYCSPEEFRKNKLSPDHVSLKNVMKYLKPFMG